MTSSSPWLLFFDAVELPLDLFLFGLELSLANGAEGMSCNSRHNLVIASASTRSAMIADENCADENCAGSNHFGNNAAAA